MTCTDGNLPENEYDLCRHGIAVGQDEKLLHLPFNMHQYKLSPDGNMLVDLIFVQPQQKLRLFNLETRQTSTLMQNKDLYLDAQSFSPDSQYLGFVWNNGEQLSVIQLESGKEYDLNDTVKPGSISWMGWVK